MWSPRGKLTYNYSIPMLFLSRLLVVTVGFRVAVLRVPLRVLVVGWYPSTVSLYNPEKNNRGCPQLDLREIVTSSFSLCLI